MKKAVLTFICSAILMGAVGAAVLPEADEKASERDSCSYLCDYDGDSMPKVFHVDD